MSWLTCDLPLASSMVDQVSHVPIVINGHLPLNLSQTDTAVHSCLARAVIVVSASTYAAFWHLAVHERPMFALHWHAILECAATRSLQAFLPDHQSGIHSLCVLQLL